MNRIKTLEGKRFKKLLVGSRTRENSVTQYNCVCDCGNTTIVSHSNLKSGSTGSCGCAILETRGSERKPLKDVIMRAIWNVYKRNAKNRHYEWSLPYEKFVSLIDGQCRYCGASAGNIFTWRYKHEAASLPVNGIDRIDNAVGYTEDNCVSCCRTCNSAKGTLTLEEFKQWSEKLFYHLQICLI